MTDLIKGITSMNSIASVAVGVVVLPKEKKLRTLEEKSGQSGRTLLIMKYHLFTMSNLIHKTFKKCDLPKYNFMASKIV